MAKGHSGRRGGRCGRGADFFPGDKISHAAPEKPFILARLPPHVTIRPNSGMHRRPAPAATATVTATPAPADSAWSVDDAKELYGFDGWGHGFFGVNKEGETTVRLENDGVFAEVSLLKIIRGLMKKNKNFHLPALFRFPDLLYARIKELNETFREEMRNQGYKGRYRGVYPVKVNQQQQVVKEVCEYGRKYHHGMEVGSKPELLAALAFMHDREALLICNGSRMRTSLISHSRRKSSV